jgi:outer membrane protein
MRRLSLILIGFYFLMVLPVHYLVAQEVKVGYVDWITIIGEFKETVEAVEEYNKELETWKKKAAEMEKEIAQLREEISSQSLMLSEETLAKKKLELEQKKKEYEKYVNDVFGEEGMAVRRSREIQQPLVEKISKTREEIAREDGYTLILDSSQTAVIYAEKSMDLTDKVLERLQQDMEKVE